MSEFIRRLIAGAVAIGAQRVRLVSAGRGGGKFRRHAQLIGDIEGRQFRFPIKLRAKDTPNRARNYLQKLQRHIRNLQNNGSPPALSCVVDHRQKPKAITRARRPRRRRFAHRCETTPNVALGDVPLIRSCSPPTSTAPNPFAVLAGLAATLSVDAEGNTTPPQPLSRD